MSAGAASPVLSAPAGCGVGACTDRSELSPQSLTDILAEGDGWVTGYLTRHKTGPGRMGGKVTFLIKERNSV